MQQATRYRFDNVEFLVGERRVRVDGRAVTLGARACDVLHTLLRHRDRVVTKDELLDAVWPNLVVEQNNVAVQIAALRKVLGPAAISTIPGRGYKYAGGPVHTGASSPAPAPVAAARGADPDAPLPLVGRTADLRRLAELLGTHRTVALTGPGGIGKTRVAQRLLWDVAHRFPDGTAWIDLAPDGDASTLVSAIARAVSLDLRGDEPLDRLLAALAHRHVLVVVDHIEVAPDAVARTVQTLMRRAPRLTFLLVGQVRLRLRDEQVVRLAGLPVPDGPVSPADARHFGAIALYVARAEACDPQFVLGEHNVTAIAARCRDLEGVPLAIDRAASGRVSATTHPLHDTLARSHARLAERERVLLRRLSVFDQDVPLDLVLEVTADDALDTWAVLDALTELVDRSLVGVSPGEPPRYRLLGGTRRFAAEALDRAGEATACRQRLALALARPRAASAPEAAARPHPSQDLQSA